MKMSKTCKICLKKHCKHLKKSHKLKKKSRSSKKRSHTFKKYYFSKLKKRSRRNKITKKRI